MELPIHRSLDVVGKNILHRESCLISLLGFVLYISSLEEVYLLFPKTGEGRETGMPRNQRHL